MAKSKDKSYLSLVNSAPIAEDAPAVKLPSAVEPALRPLSAAPEDYTEEQRAVWSEIVQQADHLADSDRWALAAMVEAVILHRTASNKVRTIGSVIKSPSGYPIQNPYVSDMNKQAALILRYSSELGLTHSARIRGKVKKQTSKKTRSGPFADLRSLTED